MEKARKKKKNISQNLIKTITLFICNVWINLTTPSIRLFSGHWHSLKPIKANTKRGRFPKSTLPPPHIASACPSCFPFLSLSLPPSLPAPFFPSLPINEAADIPDLLSQLLQDLFFVTNLQQLESRGMHVNFVCVIWWQVRLNQAPSGWMRGVQGSGIWGAEWWTGSGQGGETQSSVHVH